MPVLSAASTALLREIDVVDAQGQTRRLCLPVERSLTLFVDRHELVTLMTLGQWPELLVLGWLLNQGLVERVGLVDSISVDWDVEAAAVKMRQPIVNLRERTAQRVVTTGCGQGTVFGDMMEQLEGLALPRNPALRLGRNQLRPMLEAVRQQSVVHREAGSVHGCGLFCDGELLAFVEDVGRHNAIDSIAGWMALRGVGGDDKVFYTTGRLTSEMVMKAARMGLAIVVSRNGATALGHELARRLGMTLIGRASPHRFICYCGADRINGEALPAQLSQSQAAP